MRNNIITIDIPGWANAEQTKGIQHARLVGPVYQVDEFQREAQVYQVELFLTRYPSKEDTPDIVFYLPWNAVLMWRNTFSAFMLMAQGT